MTTLCAVRIKQPFSPKYSQKALYCLSARVEKDCLFWLIVSLKYDLCCIFTIVALCNIILKPSNQGPIVSASHDHKLNENFGYQCIFIQFLFNRIYSFISSARLWHHFGSWHVTSNVSIYIQPVIQRSNCCPLYGHLVLSMPGTPHLAAIAEDVMGVLTVVMRRNASCLWCMHGGGK